MNPFTPILIGSLLFFDLAMIFILRDLSKSGKSVEKKPPDNSPFSNEFNSMNRWVKKLEETIDEKDTIIKIMAEQASMECSDCTKIKRIAELELVIDEMYEGANALNMEIINSRNTSFLLTEFIFDMNETLEEEDTNYAKAQIANALIINLKNVKVV